jgi:membrane-bound inhibitor of C-type lysozyme
MNVPLTCFYGTLAFLVALMGPTAFAADAPHIALTVQNGSPNMLTAAHYDCAGNAVDVEYVNVEPDHLAIVPVDGRKRIFVLVISGSGARYASGQYIWWSKGKEASLYDEMKGADARPMLTCTE